MKLENKKHESCECLLTKLPCSPPSVLRVSLSTSLLSIFSCNASAISEFLKKLLILSFHFICISKNHSFKTLESPLSLLGTFVFWGLFLFVKLVSFKEKWKWVWEQAILWSDGSTSLLWYTLLFGVFLLLWYYHKWVWFRIVGHIASFIYARSFLDWSLFGFSL